MLDLLYIRGKSVPLLRHDSCQSRAGAPLVVQLTRLEPSHLELTAGIRELCEYSRRGRVQGHYK